MEKSLLRTEQEELNRSSNKNAKNGTERDDLYSTQNGTERYRTVQNGTRTERVKKRNEI